MTYERYREAIAAEVAELERGLRAHIVDLEEAFALRDWAAVARTYREIARVADRLEELDPTARSKIVERLEREQAERDEAFLAPETDELDELAMRGSDAGEASRALDPDQDYENDEADEL